ncbi:uncharacterized protein V1513DRAFT_477971 [Lipomyces chichibuensis]|uniref:uncharacterized protein n=1 Tax=Lipomyces chichibuensis TaxID=1546026 RepID=UPI0033442611
MMGLAIDSGALGDAVYLYHLIDYNGCVQYIIILDVSHTGGQVTYEDLAASTNSQELAAFYRSLPLYPSVSKKQRLDKRQGISFSSALAAVWSAYVSLYNWLKSSGNVNFTVPPRSDCIYGCCVPNVNITFSWNTSATDEKDILNSWKYILDDENYIHDVWKYILDVGTSQSMSGKWHGLSVNRTVMDFCVSNPATHLSLIDNNSY